MAQSISRLSDWSRRVRLALTILIVAAVACGGEGADDGARAQPGAAIERECVATDTADLESLAEIGCLSDFQALASLPIDVTIPGVRAVKFAIDRFNQSENPIGKLYFQNSQEYQLHLDFIKDTIQRTFDATSFNINYYGADDSRQFYLGSISYYENLDIWALELAAYDTATPAMIEKMFDVITKERAFFRPALAFHPSSESQLEVARQLRADIPVVTTDDLYAGTEYQPLTKATSMGVLTFLTSADVSSGAFIPYYSIVVLDQAPNDISVVSGIITEEFQSVLSHVNVLSTNRGTPNMGLRNAKTNEILLEHRDQWVELVVEADGWDINPVSPEEGEKFYEAHRPEPVTLSPMDFDTTELKDVREILPNYLTQHAEAITDEKKKALRESMTEVVRAYGGKTVNYAAMAHLENFPIPRAFGVPVYYYDVFMRENGFYDRVRGYLQNIDVVTGTTIDFKGDAIVRQEALRDLRNAMMKGKIDEGLQQALKERFARDYMGPGGIPTKMRFRTSTNSEDLDAFPCAGCYESHTGDPARWDTVLDAIRSTYSSTWLFRTFEERHYYGVDHESVGMALLVHGYFPDETANGVAITSNPFDLTGANAGAFYVNVAYGGEAEVVHLPEGVTTDQFLYYVDASGNNTVYVSRTNQALPKGLTTVLSSTQVGELTAALKVIHATFRNAYATASSSWYAMDVEFKFAPQDEWGIATSASTLWIKQARPYPNPND
jgi:hypothetical protein